MPLTSPVLARQFHQAANRTSFKNINLIDLRNKTVPLLITKRKRRECIRTKDLFPIQNNTSKEPLAIAHPHRENPCVDLNITRFLRNRNGLFCLRIANRAITPPAGRWVRSWDHRDDGLAFERGEEIARFNMGSTVILLFEPGRVRWEAGLRPGANVRMGEGLGSALAAVGS
jgi:hypothetical protein